MPSTDRTGAPLEPIRRMLAEGARLCLFVDFDGTPFRAIAGAPHLAEGEAAVIQPGGTRWTVVARVAPDGWAALR